MTRQAKERIEKKNPRTMNEEKKKTLFFSVGNHVIFRIFAKSVESSVNKLVPPQYNCCANYNFIKFVNFHIVSREK